MTETDCLFQIWRKRKAEEDMTRNEKKRFDIIEAARLVFLKKGFESASMDEIAKQAGVSKRTVYSNFHSKETLFSGLMGELCQNKRDAIQLQIDESLPLEEALLELGYGFLKMIFEPEGMQLFRMMIGNADTFPEIGHQFYEQGPKEVTEYVGCYLKRCEEQGLLKISDPFYAAQSLLASMFGAQYIRCLMSNCEPPNEETRKKMVKTAVDQFLKGTLVKQP